MVVTIEGSYNIVRKFTVPKLYYKPPDYHEVSRQKIGPTPFIFRAVTIAHLVLEFGAREGPTAWYGCGSCKK